MIKCGQYRILRVDGSDEWVPQRPTIEALHKALGCDAVDTLVLMKDTNDMPEIVMIIDDTGMTDGKPVNFRATQMLRGFHPKVHYPVHGDVALVNDKDFQHHGEA